MARPVVAIGGRPNVDKSTLFNRLIGKQQSVMHDVLCTYDMLTEDGSTVIHQLLETSFRRLHWLPDVIDR